MHTEQLAEVTLIWKWARATERKQCRCVLLFVVYVGRETSANAAVDHATRSRDTARPRARALIFSDIGSIERYEMKRKRCHRCQSLGHLAWNCQEKNAMRSLHRGTRPSRLSPRIGG